MRNVVVIGAGQAGAALVAKLRSEGFDGRITLIGDEPALPYQRPPLSKAYLLGNLPEERLYLRPESFYADQQIDVRLGVTVTKIDTDTQVVHLNDEALPYDHLALTTGATPRRLPAAIGGTLQGVYEMRNLADADAMAPEIQDGRKVLIIGGGYIGLEAAAVCAQKGMQVTLVEAAPRILGRVASPQTADYFRALHESHGVEIIEGVGLTGLEGADRVERAVLADGRSLEIDMAIVGIGISPNTALADQAGLTLDNGIATNAFGQTSTPNIWSAGDCASFPYQGHRIRLESVPNAIDQAEIVARNMLGAEIAYEAKPWFWSDQYDIKLQIAGLNTGYEDVVIREAGAARSHWYYAGEKLLAVDAMNDPRGYMVGKRLIEAGKTPSRAAISDPETELKTLLT